jgi:RNA polymerase sigma factor (TIGR02999 family)
MDEVSRVLSAMESGDPNAAKELLPLVYTALKRAAAEQMAREKPGQTLSPTALVHEAYVRLVDKQQQQFANRRYFFAAAAEAMRRILVENARRKQALKYGGGGQQVELSDTLFPLEGNDDETIAVHEAVDELAKVKPEIAELVKLHFFGGFSIEETAELLGISARSAYRNWAFARAWLFRHLGSGESQS